MYRDPSEFRERFKAYKEGKSVREIYRLPGYAGGKSPIEDTADFLKQYEGFRDKTYLDGKGIPTIGYGFTDAKFVNKGRITKVEADAELKRQIAFRLAKLRKKLGPAVWDSLSNDSKKALTSYRYNYPAGFEDDTKFMKYWRSGQYAKAIKEVDAGWNDSANPGLRTRRMKELLLLFSDPVLGDFIVPEAKPEPIIAMPDATRVSTIPTIQLKAIDYSDRRNAVAAETLRAIWAHNVMEDMKGAYQVPIWESPSLPALTPVEYDVTPLKTYACGKLPRYQNGREAVILQGRKQLPIDKAEAATKPDYNDGWFLTTIKRGVNNAIKTVKDQVRAARNIINGRGSLGDYIEVGIDALTGAAGKLLSGSAKEAKHVAKRTLKPTQASTKKFNTKDPNKVGAYYSAHPDEVTPITNNLDVKEVVNFMNNHVGPKYYKLNGVHVGIDPNDIKLGYADLSGSNLGGYVGPSGEVVINKDILNNRDLLRYVLGHEIAGHWFDLHYPLTVPQMSTVGYGMPFKQDFLAERPWFNAIKEANAERRAFLLMTYFDKGVLGEDLDEAIKHMAKAEAKRYIDRLGYARGIDWQWPDILPFKQAATSVPAADAGIYLAGNEEYKNGKLPGYKDGTKMQWDADAGIWRQVMDDPYADVFNNLVVTPKYIRPKFEYETNPNYKQPNKNEVVKPDETLWTRQQVEKANNTRTWLSDAANAMKYVQLASDAAGLLYGMAPGIKQRAAKAIYRNIVPASYKDSYLPGGKKQEVVNAIKDFFTPKKLDLDNSAYRKWEQENLSLFFTDTDPVAARDEIYKKYLGLPNDDFYYIKNADGTYSHNLANHEPHDIVTIINNTYNNDMGLSGKNQVLPDMLNSAGGWVNTSLKKVNDVLARFRYKDVWDVNPFKDADRVGNVFPKKLLNKYSHIEKLANGEEVRVWNKDVPWFIKKLQNFELSDFTNGAPVPVKTDINVRLLNPEEYSYTKKLTDTQIIEKMKQLDLSDAYDYYGDAMSDGFISEADWNEIELRIADKVYDTFYKDPNKYRKMFVYNVNHPLKKLFDWYGPFVLLHGYKDGKISIKPSKRGTFTAAAKKHGASVREFESRVLKNPEKYSKAMVKKARFSRNARSWKH